MSTDERSTTPPPRRFGAPFLALAIVASAVVAGGGAWLLTRHGGGGATGAAPGQGQAAATGPQGQAATAEQKERWQCPMHPSIVRDHPGDCPICGMKLVKMEARGGTAGERKVLFYRSPMDPKQTSPGPRKDEMGMDYLPVYSDEVGNEAIVEGLATVDIDPERQQLIGLEVAHAQLGPVGGSWRTNGRVAIDETRVHHVNVKFSGFMEHVYADFVGRPVKKGEPIFSIYSPELVAAQEEYLLALRTRRTLGEAGSLGRDGDALVEAARRKLELWDVPRSEVERIERSGQPSRTLTFYSPATGVLTKKDVVPGMRVNAGDMPFEIVDLSRVWVLADAYETDLRQVKVGMDATLTLRAFPNRTFSGRVAFIDPFLDPRSRTAKVRVEFPNPTGELRPEMFGEVVLQGKSREGVRIPTDAVIQTGTQTVVFVALGSGKFQPREVKLGEGDAELVEVVSGLEQGEGVVTRANFLIDSESRLRASLAALSSPNATAPASAGHAGGAAPAGEPARKIEAAPANPHAGHGR